MLFVLNSFKDYKKNKNNKIQGVLLKFVIDMHFSSINVWLNLLCHLFDYNKTNRCSITVRKVKFETKFLFNKIAFARHYPIALYVISHCVRCISENCFSLLYLYVKHCVLPLWRIEMNIITIVDPFVECLNGLKRKSGWAIFTRALNEWAFRVHGESRRQLVA